MRIGIPKQNKNSRAYKARLLNERAATKLALFLFSSYWQPKKSFSKTRIISSEALKASTS